MQGVSCAANSVLSSAGNEKKKAEGGVGGCGELSHSRVHATWRMGGEKTPEEKRGDAGTPGMGQSSKEIFADLPGKESI